MNDEVKVDAQLLDEAKRANVDQKLQAMRQELQLLRQAQQDQHTANMRTQNNIASLNTQLTASHDKVRAEEDEIDETKQRMFIAKKREQVENPTIPLPQLHETAVELRDHLEQVQIDVVALETALGRVLDYKEIVEKDLKKQIAKGEKLASDLQGARTSVKTVARRNRDIMSSNAGVQRSIDDEKRKISNLKGEAKYIDRYSQRAEKKMNQYGKEIQHLQQSRTQSKQLVVDEVALANERDQWISQLREENCTLTDALLTRHRLHGTLGATTTESTVGNIVEEACEVETAVKGSAPSIKPVPLTKTREEQVAEVKMLANLEQAVQSTTQAAVVPASRR